MALYMSLFMELYGMRMFITSSKYENTNKIQAKQPLISIKKYIQSYSFLHIIKHSNNFLHCADRLGCCWRDECKQSCFCQVWNFLEKNNFPHLFSREVVDWTIGVSCFNLDSNEEMALTFHNILTDTNW